MNTARILDLFNLIRDAMNGIEAVTTEENVDELGGEVINSAAYFIVKAVRDELDRAEAEVKATREEVRTA